PMASFGVVSATGGTWRTHQGTSVEGFIRADVAMLPGFSGGPLVDGDGNVVGMNTSMLGRGGGLTIPVAAIESVVASLLAHGKVRRGYLGVGAQAVGLNPRLAQALGLTQERG
ncbi:MAG: signal protein PDZ, partial [Chloroflexota bacterium]